MLGSIYDKTAHAALGVTLLVLIYKSGASA